MPPVDLIGDLMALLKKPKGPELPGKTPMQPAKPPGPATPAQDTSQVDINKLAAQLAKRAAPAAAVTAGAAAAGAPSSVKAQEQGVDLQALRSQLTGAKPSPSPGGVDLQALQGGLEQKSGGGLMAQFMETIRAPESEMFDRHSTYAGRLKDIPHDIVHERAAGVETLKNIGHREPGQGFVSGLVSDLLRIVGGGAQLTLAPAGGALRSMVGRPVAENYDVSFREGEPTSAEQFHGRSFLDKLKAATPKGHITARDAPEPASDEDIDKIAGAASFAIPGLGIVRYRDLGQRLRASGLGQGVQRLLSPTTISDNARTAETLIRGAGGTAARNTETTRAVLDLNARVANMLPPAQQLDFINHVEQGTHATLPGPLRQLASDMHDAFEERRTQLQQLPSTANATFVEDYFPHMWQDPNRARGAFGAGAPSRQGSGASLHARSIPTIADGIAQGLVPITTNPVELSMRYITSIDRFIAAERTREAALQTGYARWVRPRVVGASGHPQSFDAPQGWTPLEGRGARNANGARLYAPDDFARVYNNFISRPVEGEWGDLFNTALRSSNAVTALELSLSAYHYAAMTHEAAVGQMSTAVQNIVGGARQGDWRQILRGTAQAATAPVAALPRTIRGHQLERVYLGQTPGTPDMARIVGLLERAGGRAAGSRHAQVQATAANNFYQAWRAGTLRAVAAADAAEATQSWAGAARVTFRNIGRAMDTLSHPLFNVYIPKLKNGAFYDTMQAWLHNHPNATHEEQVAAARMVWDSIDNRFGEMVQDNIFWHNTAKRIAQLGLRSYSWNLGTFREIGGGAMDVAAGRGAGRGAAGQHPSTLIDSTRAAYIVALPITVAYVNAVYQYLKTGQGPQSVDDLVTPRTGGEVPGPAVPSMKPFGHSQRNEIAERAILPGYQKDVFGWYNDWYAEATNKIATLPRVALQLLRNEDFRGLPIVNPEASAPAWLQQYFKFVVDNFGPITMRQKNKPGTAIGKVEGGSGVREAPAYMSDPEDYREQKRAINMQKWRLKTNIDRRQDALYGTDEE